MTELRRQRVGLGEALIESLTTDELQILAARLRPFLDLGGEPNTEAVSGWMDSGAAADYLGMSRPALHKLTATRAIPFEQDGPGCKLWFIRAKLDQWRRERSVT